MNDRIMTLQKHVQLLSVVSSAWLLFWLAGLPDYYQQYSATSMLIFDLLVLPPIWFLIYRKVRSARPGRGLEVSLWWAFYVTVPLFLYDLIYCGYYLGHQTYFLTKYWYLTIYYFLPWILFPPMGWIMDRKTELVL